MTRPAEESIFETFDKTKLFFRIWKSAKGVETDSKVIILMHRGHEHSGRLQEIVDSMEMPDVTFFAYDARGHGRSPGPRGFAEDFSNLPRDLDCFFRLITEKYGFQEENLAIIANSVGAAVTACWLVDYNPRIRAAVLAAPAFEIKLYIPLAIPALRLLNKVRNPSFISSYVKSTMLTHDSNEAKKYNKDPLITRDIAVNILLGLADHSKRVLEQAHQIVVPVLVLSAGKDFVVHGAPQRQFFESLSSPIKEFKTYPNFYHGVLYEKDREIAFADVRNFLKKTFTFPVARTFLLSEDKNGKSRIKFENLSHISFVKKCAFFFQRLSMRTLGQLSYGIRLGFKEGFDSGLSLDHVYKNIAVGSTFLGRLIDRTFLDAIGWRGIRIRKVHLQEILKSAIAEHRARGLKTVNILDIAGGPGRYLLEFAAQDAGLNVQIRDYMQSNVDAGQEHAKQMQLSNVNFLKVDAFGQNVPEFQADIIIVSGLMELYPDNERVMIALRNALKSAGPQTRIIYTGQAWHPQLEMIAATLPNREGKDWMMRPRGAAELDELFFQLGFKKEQTLIDRFGIFSVSLAKPTA